MERESDSRSLFTRLGGRPALELLLRRFYADVRQHREIGPIFLRQVDDWPAHLAKIADFWSTATGGPSVYQGAMPAKHVPLALEEKHFTAWLDLWRRHCRAHFPPPEAEELILVAETIGDRLRRMTGVRGERVDLNPLG